MNWFSRTPSPNKHNPSTIVDLATTEAGLVKLLHDNQEFYKVAAGYLSEIFLREVEDKEYTAEDMAYVRGAAYMLRRITQLVSQEIHNACDQNIKKRGEV